MCARTVSYEKGEADLLSMGEGTGNLGVYVLPCIIMHRNRGYAGTLGNHRDD